MARLRHKQHDCVIYEVSGCRQAVNMSLGQSTVTLSAPFHVYTESLGVGSWPFENKALGTAESTNKPMHDMPFTDENSIQYDDNTDTALVYLHRDNCKTCGRLINFA